MTRQRPQEHQLPELTVTRRRFMGATGSAATGLWLALEFPAVAVGQQAPRTTFGDTQLAAYLEITADNVVHVTVPDAEMGQGVFHSLALVLADELGADWERVDIRQSGADDRLANPLKGFQATGRSLAMRGYYPLLRRLGATARVLLCQAAARRWQVPVRECTAAGGQVVHGPSGRTADFGGLLPAAAALPLPLEAPLKAPGDLRLIGRRVPRRDVPAKVTGEAKFAIDTALPGLLVAAIRQSPVFGSPVASLDDAAARALPGVRGVVKLKDAVAVVAGDYWHARKALDAVKVTFAASPNDALTSASQRQARVDALSQAGVTALERGDPAARTQAASRRFEFRYEVPYLAHATMEPMTCTAWVKADGCELWAPTQGPGRLRNDVARALGIEPARVKITRPFLGGGFGRRWQSDFGVQAALISREIGGPVKLVWSREEDIQHDFYRPAMLMEVRAGLEGKQVAGMEVTLVGDLLSGWGRPAVAEPVPDQQLLGGLTKLAYALPDYRVRWVPMPGHVPIGVWRSVAYSHNVFAVESAMDELAREAGMDPVEFRLGLLRASPRHARVLQAAAKLGNWGRSLPAGESLGVAMAEYATSVIAVVAHIARVEGKIRVRRLSAALDCGLAVQPDGVLAQIEGGMLFGLSAALYGEVQIDQGRAVQSNFHDYRLLRMADAPQVEVTLLESDAELGGIGETGTPPVAPAVTSALFALTGQRIRMLPLSRHGLVA